MVQRSSRERHRRTRDESLGDLTVTSLAGLSGWRLALVGLLATRAVLFGVGLVALVVLPLGFRHLALLPDFPALQMWAQWDSEHYVAIAVHGYESPTVAF